MIDDMEGSDEFFDSITLPTEDEISTDSEMEFGGYTISFYDGKINRNLTFTLNTES